MKREHSDLEIVRVCVCVCVYVRVYECLCVRECKFVACRGKGRVISVINDL